MRPLFLSLFLIMNTQLSLIERGSPLFQILDGVADATNYLLICWLLVILILGTKNKSLTSRAWIATLLSIAAVYIVKTFDGKLDLWERAGWNYSTHSAVAAAVVISLFFLDQPRRFLALGIFGFYEILIMLLGFHTPSDIVSTLLVIAPIAWLLHALLGRKQTPVAT